MGLTRRSERSSPHSRSPITVCVLICSYSSDVSLPGLSSTLSGNADLADVVEEAASFESGQILFGQSSSRPKAVA